MNEPRYELGDWFSNNIPNWEAWLAEFVGKRTFAIEIGSCEGRSARWLLEHVLTDSMSQLLCVDPEVRTTLLDNLSGFGTRVLINAVRSRDFWPRVIGYRYELQDLIYIDGSHRARDVLADAVYAWQALRPGGILIFDDYRYGPADDPKATEWDRPGPAIDAFLSAYRDELAPLADVPHAPNPGWQKAVRKLV